MVLKCLKCRKLVEATDEKTRCPYCGYRILVKMRPKVVKRVHAR